MFVKENPDRKKSPNLILPFRKIFISGQNVTSSSTGTATATPTVELIMRTTIVSVLLTLKNVTETINPLNFYGAVFNSTL